MKMLKLKSLMFNVGAISFLLLTFNILLLTFGSSTASAATNIGSVTATSTTGGLVGWWTLDGQDIGPNIKDRSRNTDFGTLWTGASATTTIAGAIGQAISLDGDDYITIPHNTVLSPQYITVSAWVKPVSTSNTNYPVVINKGTINNSYLLFFGEGAGDGHPIFRVNSDGGGLSAATYSVATPLNVWTHFVGTYDGSTIRLYQNGRLVASTILVGTRVHVDTGVLTVGNASAGGTNPYQGAVDDIRIYARAISPQEVQRLYSMGATAHAPSTIGSLSTASTTSSGGLVGWWTLDKQDIGPNIIDRSKYGSNGFKLGATATSTGNVVGAVGQSFIFNGTSDYITIPDNNVLDTGNKFSISAWVYPTGNLGTTRYGIYSTRKAPTGGWQLELGTGSGGTARVAVTGTNTWIFESLSNAIVANAWNHILYVRSSSSDGGLMFVNGARVNSYQTNTYSVTNNTEDKEIGRGPGGSNYFKGGIDDVRLYNNTLTAADARRLYSMGQQTHVNTTVKSAGNLKNGLVGHWTFDGPQMNPNVRDTSTSSSYNANLILGTSGNTSTTTISGVIGQALKFDGTDDYVNPNTNFNKITTLTISMWFRTGSLAGQALFGQANTSPPNAAASYVPTIRITTAGLLQAELYSISTIGTTNSVADNKWHHVAVVGTGSSEFLYLDGALVTSQGGSIDFNWWNASQIGTAYDAGARSIGPAGWRYFNGSLDDVRVYNRALSAGEVRQLYQLGR